MEMTRRNALQGGFSGLGRRPLRGTLACAGEARQLGLRSCDRRVLAGPDRRRQGVPQGGGARLQARGRQRRHPRPAIARSRTGAVRARGRKPPPPALDPRQESQDRPGDPDDRLDRQHRRAQGPVRRRHRQCRKARRLQAAERRQADSGGDGDRLRHVDVRHLHVRIEGPREHRHLGRRRRPQHDVAGARDEAVRCDHGGARVGHRGREQGLRQGHLRHVEAGRLYRRLRRHRAGARDLHARGHDRAKSESSCSPS